MGRSRYSAVWFLTAWSIGCADPPASRVALPEVQLDYSETREVCADRDPLRRVYYGDLHVHTGFSFDARNYGNVLNPDDAYRFAQGEGVMLAPLDTNGQGTREARLDRPLDFVGVTDHGEFLGEIYRCTTPDAEGYDSSHCVGYRDPAQNSAFQFALPLSVEAPKRFSDVCGDAPMSCADSAELRWLEVQTAAEANYDRSPVCGFTTFVGYEYTNTFKVSNLHRNVIFRNANVPSLPITHFEAPTPLGLWTALGEQCLEGGEGCDVLVLPHNSNLSNGRLFEPDYPAGREAEIAALRARMEPVVEIYQHKGDSECRRGLSGFGATDDPACDFEKLRTADAMDCGDEVGAGGMRLWGCVHRLDFVRNVLKQGLLEARKWAVNPYRLGFIGSTDTHNGTPGLVRSVDFPGHVGVVDDTSARRLGPGNITHDAKINNPGGLAAVWAIENSRDAIFEAIRRRETFATSGPRIALRFFGLASAPDDDLCGDSERLARAYADGVPMGGVLESATPHFMIEAEADPGTSQYPGADLDRLQIVKGWVDTEGEVHERVVDVTAAVEVPETDSCASAEGSKRLCAVWRDPDTQSGDAQVDAFYYARVLEVPTCRWSALECDALPATDRPKACDDGSLPRWVQHRAWASPVWVEGRSSSD